MHSLAMRQAQRCPDAQGVPDSDPVVRQRRDGQQPRAASRSVLCTESEIQVTRRTSRLPRDSGLCAPPRRGFFSIFVYTRIILSGQSFRGSSILSATSCRVGACRATANQAKMTSGSTASVAWENLARTGRSQRRLTMSSVFICNQRVSSSGTGAKLQLARPTHHLSANLSLFELDLVVDDYLKRPLLIAGRLLFQVALFDRPGWVNHLLGVIGRLQHPGRILCKADSDCRRCAALVRSSYLP